VTYPSDSEVKLRLEQDANNFSVRSREHTQKSTVNLLRTLVTMGATLRALPDERLITIKLLYYDERTPTNYEPKFFKATSQDVGFDSKPLKANNSFVFPLFFSFFSLP
jgi:hypothetical protein